MRVRIESFNPIADNTAQNAVGKFDSLGCSAAAVAEPRTLLPRKETLEQVNVRCGQA
jgi:hypothetical protein